MLKLYRRVKGELHYHEAWAQGDTIIEHWGKLGERGQTTEHKRPMRETEEGFLQRILAKPLENGFKPLDEDDSAVLLIEYTVEGHGNSDDLRKRHALEDRLNETLGWTGLGHCDGGSIGSGTMEVCCYVVDFDVAKRVIEDDLRGTEFADFSRIIQE